LYYFLKVYNEYQIPASIKLDFIAVIVNFFNSKRGNTTYFFCPDRKKFSLLIAAIKNNHITKESKKKKVKLILAGKI